ncbi:MAG: hypothetical protein HY791_33095 [Deltaproteobacteria bacterium]|nr:hypothetical protein [Deltaproteobacteria bacterium]
MRGVQGVRVLLLALLMAACVDRPPVLLDPIGARASVVASPCDPMQDAETVLLAGDPGQALKLLARAPEGPRKVRLMLDGQLADRGLLKARATAEVLAQFPGWLVHASRQAGMIERADQVETWTRIGTTMFALSLMMLSLAGLRELLKLRKESLVVLVGILLSLGFSRLGGPATPLGLPLVVVSWGALGHAAVATAYRVEPGGRGRALLIALLATGMLGSSIAVLAQALSP